MDEAICDPSESVLPSVNYVLQPTGTGKTETLIRQIGDRKTVIAEPTIALIEDVRRRCESAQKRAVVVHGKTGNMGRAFEHNQVVITTFAFLREFLVRGNAVDADFICIDEAHTVPLIKLCRIRPHIKCELSLCTATPTVTPQGLVDAGFGKVNAHRTIPPQPIMVVFTNADPISGANASNEIALWQSPLQMAWYRKFGMRALLGNESGELLGNDAPVLEGGGLITNMAGVQGINFHHSDGRLYEGGVWVHTRHIKGPQSLIQLCGRSRQWDFAKGCWKNPVTLYLCGPDCAKKRIYKELVEYGKTYGMYSFSLEPCDICLPPLQPPGKEWKVGKIKELIKGMPNEKAIEKMSKCPFSIPHLGEIFPDDAFLVDTVRRLPHSDDDRPTPGMASLATRAADIMLMAMGNCPRRLLPRNWHEIEAHRKSLKHLNADKIRRLEDDDDEKRIKNYLRYIRDGLAEKLMGWYPETTMIGRSDSRIVFAPDVFKEAVLGRFLNLDLKACHMAFASGAPFRYKLNVDTHAFMQANVRDLASKRYTAEMILSDLSCPSGARKVFKQVILGALYNWITYGAPHSFVMLEEACSQGFFEIYVQGSWAPMNPGMFMKRVSDLERLQKVFHEKLDGDILLAVENHVIRQIRKLLSDKLGIFPLTVSDGLVLPILDISNYILGPKIDEGCYQFLADPFRTGHLAVDESIAKLFPGEIETMYDIESSGLPKKLWVVENGDSPVWKVPGRGLVESRQFYDKLEKEKRKEWEKRYHEKNSGKYPYVYRNSQGNIITADQYRALSKMARKDWGRTRRKIP